MIQKGNTTFLQCFPKDYFAAVADRSKYLHAISSGRLFCTHYVGNVICHKFSHNDISYRFNGKNLNAMLEFWIITAIFLMFEVSRLFFSVNNIFFPHSEQVMNEITDKLISRFGELPLDDDRSSDQSSGSAYRSLGEEYRTFTPTP